MGVFLDELIIYCKFLKEHKVHVKAIFEELRAKGLYINEKKYKDFHK